MTRPISRRLLLQGTGVALALPLLDAMAPWGLCAERKTPARMVTICTTLGLHAPDLIPAQSGKDYQVTPYLERLKAFRDDFTVFSGLSHPGVDGGHSSESSFLTAAPRPADPGFKNTVSLDQFAVERLPAETRFSSLVLSTGSVGSSSLSWTRGGVMIPADILPSKVFARLFLNGSAAEVQSQVRRLRDGRSILDQVGERARRLQRDISSADRAKLEQYYTSVRELEQRLQRGEEWAQLPKPNIAAPPPADIADKADLIGRTRLMYDLVHLALQTDSTRLITLQIQGTALVPPLPGVSRDHHNLSHHGQDPEKIKQLRLVEEAQLEALAGLLGQLKETAEEGRPLLESTMVLFGSNLGNGNSHDTKNMPMVLAGGRFKHGQHLAFDPANNAPLCNLFVSMLQQLGLEVDSFASSTSKLTGLVSS
ncbi:MAG: hypothetical protein JWN70_5680 [Planctomycetaceae bacterium]|nr:hypothetical protein [Planctomycetaceae bacterium]